mgnify:CR=1 FL=1
MTIANEVRELEEENERLREQLRDVQLVRDALTSLLKIVDEIIGEGLMASPDAPREQSEVLSEQQSRYDAQKQLSEQQYTVTEVGGSEPKQEAAFYKVDVGDMLDG